MPIFESSSDSDNEGTPQLKLFGRHRPVDAILGGGKVADVLLWRDPKVSATLLLGVTMIWFLFEVVEYNLVTLLCHISITTMLVIFIWCISADYFGWNRPNIPELLSNETAFYEVVSVFHWRFNQFLKIFLHIAGGNDPVNFFLVIISLYITSVIGSYFDFLNLLFLGFVSLGTLSYLYSRYENEVDYHAGRMSRKGNIQRERENNMVRELKVVTDMDSGSVLLVLWAARVTLSLILAMIFSCADGVSKEKTTSSVDASVYGGAGCTASCGGAGCGAACGG
ncbi:hypothetical protein V6N11_021444 [Hibiscus sabdariffa]|uniref:Reticulon-like protein n=1 Tax=Hibiscus sabdariffa TaxID=183260 RepID=A0ABR2A2X8_9ROSI